MLLTFFLAERDCLRSTKTTAKSLVKVFHSFLELYGTDINMSFRSITFVLHSLSSGQLDIWCRRKSYPRFVPHPETQSLTMDIDPLPFHREGILPHQPPMADWFPGNNGRRCDHLHSIPYLRSPGPASVGGFIVLDFCMLDLFFTTIAMLSDYILSNAKSNLVLFSFGCE